MEVARPANELMERIAVVVQVLPVPVLASVVLEQRDGLLRAAPDAEDVLSYDAISINRWCLPAAGARGAQARL